MQASADHWPGQARNPVPRFSPPRKPKSDLPLRRVAAHYSADSPRSSRYARAARVRASPSPACCTSSTPRPTLLSTHATSRQGQREPSSAATLTRTSPALRVATGSPAAHQTAPPDHTTPPHHLRSACDPSRCESTPANTPRTCSRQLASTNAPHVHDQDPLPTLSAPRRKTTSQAGSDLQRACAARDNQRPGSETLPAPEFLCSKRTVAFVSPARRPGLDSILLPHPAHRAG